MLSAAVAPLIRVLKRKENGRKTNWNSNKRLNNKEKEKVKENDKSKQR